MLSYVISLAASLVESKKLPEREEFSDEELSDEEHVSDEEFVIPRKRKLKTEDVVNKRIKPDAKPSANLVLKIQRNKNHALC